MRRYETIVILKPTLGEEENQAVIDRTTGIIEDFTGSIIKIDKWGLKKLAYLIKKETQGYYIYMVYAGMPAGVDEMERVFRIDDRVMKFLTVKLQDVYIPLPEDVEEKPAEAPAEEASEAKKTVASTQAEEPVTEAATEEPVTEAATEEPVTEAATEEPIAEAATEEPIAEAATEEPIAEAATDEDAADKED